MYQIGELAKLARVNVETIRYYARQNLIEQPAKPATSYRLYSEQILQRVLFIKKAQQLGFTLEEIRQLLELNDAPCRGAQSLAEQKLSTVQEKIADLRQLENALNELVTQCQRNADEQHCPLLESLLTSRR